jgi:hypothetical protein
MCLMFAQSSQIPSFHPLSLVWRRTGLVSATSRILRICVSRDGLTLIIQQPNSMRSGDGGQSRFSPYLPVLLAGAR